MKVSRFNFFIAGKNGERIAFNAMTTALAKMNEEHYSEYKLIEQGLEGQSPVSPRKRKKIHKDLMKGGFIYPDDAVDEMALIEHFFLREKYDDRVLNLTIAPTMDCNFNCYYCYEKKPGLKKTYMSEKTVDDVIKFVDSQLKYKIKLAITWYGGEPLLAFDTIKRLSEKFLESTRKYHCEYTSQIVTNGYLFEKNVIDQLLKYNLKSAQITLDGPKYVHDARRYDRHTRASFDKIIKNIEYARDFIRMNIQVNLDKENIDKVDDFFDYLIEKKLVNDNIGVYLGRVVDCNQRVELSRMNLMFNSSDYYKKEKEIIVKAIQEKNLSWVGGYPGTMLTPCGAICLGTFSIDPEGYVYKCWEVMGNQKEALYHVSNPVRASKNELRWINWDPKTDEECKTCKHLPLCHGGCVWNAMNGKKSCSYWKENLNDMLSVLAYKYEHLVNLRQ